MVNDIYICDYSNNRVKILSNDFLFKSRLGSFDYTYDVKLSKEYIYVLDESNPCIYLLNHNHILQKSVISLRQGNQVINPYSFFIDNSNNILIVEFCSNSISIFYPEFQSIHNIPVSELPTAVTVDNHNRVIIVCYYAVNCLPIFDIQLYLCIFLSIFFHFLYFPFHNSTYSFIPTPCGSVHLSVFRKIDVGKFNPNAEAQYAEDLNIFIVKEVDGFLQIVRSNQGYIWEEEKSF
ncbi:Tripartite motif-containing protein 2 isoform X2 [Oopsacas minuta]|uniref:Tripartite motif-containing protein 2 isoform X2 n=1 Tax=Oopsacas minuta TaxID=111878 RepID=A0AAV7KAR4_9METZ|nr:Tripartite motif-containing protein 2 isoform X2 [Oopsacas minuta]